ncbi:hypothetical protein [Bacteroides zoogleoformans]|uniref:hypothetical protein n=1 Tax=Bacteroides zoogleoformans TaxID=28119 RepID=UPI00248E849B|nr:hypothetical protein [Bacteroides zoogleoformans]
MKRETIERLQRLFGNNFIGPDQINKLMSEMGLKPISDNEVPEVEYPMHELKSRSGDYILVLGYCGTSELPLDIIRFRDTFGMTPDNKEPCLYNQDWYLCEDFVHKTLEFRWYLLKKEVFEERRSVLPDAILSSGEVHFPSAVLCIFTFFAYYFAFGEYLWYHDFVWCSDLDHNGDRIYVGKYHDVDGVNKNGFSIHRHLALRPCYSAISVL